MRLRTLILVGSVLFASACAKTSFDEVAPQGEGSISIQLAPEIEVKSETKAMAGGPDKNEFKIEIYKYTSSDLVRLYRDSYANTVGQKIKLNSAPYKIHARHGDSLAAGFNSIYYAGQAIVNVRPQTDESVTIEAKMANVKVAVEYGDNLKYDWPEYYAKVKSTTPCGRKRNLQFSQNEKRAGYLPHGNFVVELYVKIGEEWKYYHSPQMEALPNDFITFKVDTEKAESDAVLTARIDRDLEVIEKSLMMSSDWLPKDAPAIVQKDGNGADFGNRTFTIIEANNGSRSDLKADINVPGRIKNCWLEVTSDYLAGLGVPSRVDLAGDLEPSVEQALKSVGLKWMKGMSGQRLAYVDFSGITTWLDKQPCGANLFNATFSLDVIDQRQAVGQTQSEPVKFVQGKPAFEFYDIPSYNCWAWQIKNISTYLTAGNPEVLVLEYKKSSENDSAWKVLDPIDNDPGNTAKIYNLLKTTPGTTYNFRLRYNGNPVTQIVKSVTTESAAQIPNYNFSQWSQFSHVFDPAGPEWLGGASTTYTWHRPYSGTQFWDINAKVSMPSEGEGWTNPNVKCFPCAGRSTSCQTGAYSALLFVVSVGRWNTNDTAPETKYTGELFIGSANNSGSPTYGKVSLTSRPSAVKVVYKYAPYGSEKFSMNFDLYSGSTKLATLSAEGSAASDWSELILPLSYTSSTQKATDVAVRFKASTSASGVNVKTTIEYGGGSYTAHIGSQLRIDRVELIYE
jgi:hypothetical protein